MTWDPNKKGVACTLSNGNLTAFFLGGSFLYESTGGTQALILPNKRYYEVVLDETATSGSNRFRNSGIGICDADFNFNSDAIGAITTGHSAGLVHGAEGTFCEMRWTIPGGGFGSAPTTILSASQGDILQVAINGGTIWAGVNNVWYGDPAAGTGGAGHAMDGAFYAVFQAWSDTCKGTATFSAPFAGVVPAGFYGWEEQVVIDTPAVHFDYAMSNTNDTLITATLYQARLTGEGNGEEDLLLPISSFRLSRQIDGEDTLSCVIPDGQNYASLLATRGSGQLIVEQYTRHLDGSTANFRQIGWVEWNDLRVDYGPRSRSITIGGRKDVPYRSPRTVIPQGVSSRSNANGIRSLTGRIDPDVLPGDTINFNNEEWIVASVNMTANPSQGDQMELSED